MLPEEKEVEEVFKELSQPLRSEEVEWRLDRSGVGNNGKPWARCVAYISNRAIQERLDKVVGPQNWENVFQEVRVVNPKNDARLSKQKDFSSQPEITAIMCGIRIRVKGEWITKWDASELTDYEAVKGGFSTAMKRAAVQWGIGRYLYNVGEGWAEFSENGLYKVSIENTWYKWSPPPLPDWALQTGEQLGKSEEDVSEPETAEEPQAPVVKDWRSVKIHFGTRIGETLGKLPAYILQHWQDTYEPKPNPKTNKLSLSDMELRKALDESIKDNGMNQSAPGDEENYYTVLQGLLEWNEMPTNWVVEKLLEIKKITQMCSYEQLPEGLVRNVTENFDWFARKWAQERGKEEPSATSF